MNSYTLACLGKGGTGKTLVTTLIGRIARDAGLRALLVDADPVMGLSVSCGLKGVVTVADAREEIIERVRGFSPDTPEQETLEIVRWMVARTLLEHDGLGFLVMGQRRSLGCYCALNLLLRRMLAAVVARFDLVVVDAEAGIEQVNREVVERIDQALLLSDGSRRAVETCVLVRDTIRRIPMMEQCRMGVLFNRVASLHPQHQQMLEQAGLPVLGVLAPDEHVSRADRDEGTLSGLGPEAPSYESLRQVLRDLKVL